MQRRAALSLLFSLGLAPTAGWAAEAHKKGGGTGFAAFPTLTATLIRPNGSRGVLALEAGLDTKDEALKALVERNRPRLRDAWNTTLQRYGLELAPGSPPDLDELSRRLQADADRILGRPGAKLLLGSCIVT